MVTFWCTALAIVLAITAIVTHEAAHGVALRQAGFGIDEVAIGIPAFPRLVLPPSPRRPFRLTISPWLVWAYVKPACEMEELEALPYRQGTWFYGAGIAVNLVEGLALAAAAHAAAGTWIPAAWYAAAAVVVWVFRRQVVMFAVPVAGLAGMAVVFWELARDLQTGQSGGVAGIWTILLVRGPVAALYAGAIVALSLALLNMIPLMPLDGGRIAVAAVRRVFGDRGARVFARAGLIGVAVLFAAAFASDAGYLLRIFGA